MKKIRTFEEFLSEENRGLWHNIRAKRARGSKPARKGSKAYKKAVLAAKKINENFVTSNCVDENFVSEIDPKLANEIGNYVQEKIMTYNKGFENSGSEIESEAIEYFADTLRIAEKWRIYSDGTLDVILESNRRDYFNFSWQSEEEDEDETTTRNFLDCLDGEVGHKFDDTKKSGDNNLPDELKVATKKFFIDNKNAIMGKKFGL